MRGQNEVISFRQGIAMRARIRGNAWRVERNILLVLAACGCLMPILALAQIVGGGPFSTGAANFQSNLLTILAPIAVIGVMVIGVAAWFNRISWGWAAAAAGGLILVFGAP